MNSGIYAIINILNGDMYIGSSIHLYKRYLTHQRLLRKQKHHSIHMQRAWNKYKECAFVFVILLKCEPCFVLEKELEFFKIYKPKYNIAKSPASPMKGRKHKKKTIQKMKNRIVPKGENHYNYGKKLTKEHIAKILKSREGYTHSKKTKEKMKDTANRLNRYKDLIVGIEKNKKKILDSNGNLFNSIVECSKFHKISPATVCDILKGRHKKTRNGIYFKYYE